jgi:hypothetical protein
MTPTRAFGGFLATLVVSLGVFADEAQQAAALRDSFIWAPSAQTGTQVYAIFRKTFNLMEQPKSASLRLFADSRYILWVNGQYVNRGPCRFDPKGPEYDTFDVARLLQSGPNVVAVVVHHYHDGKPQESGDGLCGRIMRHAPGLTASLELSDSTGARAIDTDRTWRVSTQHRFGPAPASWTSIPDRIDARRDAGDWTAVAFDDSTWQKAVPIDGKQWGPLRARRIPLLRETEVGSLRVIQRQNAPAAPEDLPNRPELSNLLPIDLSAGNQIVIDADRFVQAYVVVDMEADAGSTLEFEFAQAFFSTGNKPTGMQNPGASRYTTREGRQTYMGGDTFGCKYVVIRCAAGKIRLIGLKLIDRLYPFDVAGKFTSSDPLLNDIWRLGVRTVQTCSEDAHVDCASRERAEWIADTLMVGYPIVRLTMAGPGVEGKAYWSDPRLFGNMLRHIGQSAQPDGRVKAHHPSDRWDIHGYIEDFSCLWIQGVRSWHDNTGDLELVREMWPAITGQLKWFLDRRSERGLVKAREFVFPGNPLCYQTCEGATFNAFLVRAIADAAELARLLGDGDRQRQYTDAGRVIESAVNTHLWDEAAGTYYGAIKDGQKTPATVHAAAMCLYFDVVPASQRKRVEKWFFTNMEQEEAYPYQYAFYLDILARMDSDAADGRALELIRRRWEPMTRFETKTTWEGFGPDENCHEIGGAPTVYLSRHVLGVGVQGPADDHRLTIRPHLGDLKRAEGIVATEFGPVPVRWDRGNDNGRFSFEIEIPAGVTARVSLPRPADNAKPTIDGQAVKPLPESSPRFLEVELGAGRHHGTL